MSRFAATLVLAALAIFLLPPAKRVPGEPPKSEAFELKALQEERIETLTQIARLLRSQYEQGAVEFRRLADAQMELVKAKVECADSVEDSVALLEELLAMAKGVLDVTETRHRAGFRTSQIDVYEAKSLYLNIKIRLVRARAKLKRPAK